MGAEGGGVKAESETISIKSLCRVMLLCALGLLSCPYPILSHPIPSHPIASHPIPSFPILSNQWCPHLLSSEGFVPGAWWLQRRWSLWKLSTQKGVFTHHELRGHCNKIGGKTLIKLKGMIQNKEQFLRLQFKFWTFSSLNIHTLEFFMVFLNSDTVDISKYGNRTMQNESHPES